MSELVERVARAIVKAGGDDPDALLRWPDPDPCWKGAIPEAKAAIAAMQGDAAPVVDRVSTSSPVDDRASPNTSVKLRDAVEVWEDAYGSYMLNEVGQDYEAAAAIIEQDREAVRAEQAAEIAALKSAWEAQHKEKVAERAEAKLWFAQAQEAKTELAKWKALAETLAGALDKLHEAYCADDYGTSEGRAFGRTALIETREALREYKETRDA